MSRVKTIYKNKIFDEYECRFIYKYLRDNIKWEEGIRSKSGFTRLGKAINLLDDEMVFQIIVRVLNMFNIGQSAVSGIYLNYYKDGTYYTPSHRHDKTKQIIISFNEVGGERVLSIGSKDYEMENGSAIIFGSSNHTVRKQENKNGRISIALFVN